MPSEGEQFLLESTNSLDLADFLKRDVDLVLALVRGQFAQYRQRRDMPCLQRGAEAQNLRTP